VELLGNIDNYERSKLADTLREERYGQGDYIIRDGEEGHSFYIVLEGKAVATKTMGNGIFK
jgi:cAMP-dependent protein kinase regulator